jgi:hypothetical protein
VAPCDLVKVEQRGEEEVGGDDEREGGVEGGGGSQGRLCAGVAGDAGVEGLDRGEGCFGALREVSFVCLDIDYVESEASGDPSAIGSLLGNFGSLW